MNWDDIINYWRNIFISTEFVIGLVLWVISSVATYFNRERIQRFYQRIVQPLFRHQTNGLIIALLSASAVFGAVCWVTGKRNFLTLVLLLIGFGGGALRCFSRFRTLPKNHKLRYLVLAGGGSLLLTLAVILILPPPPPPSPLPPPPEKFIILIADFEGPEPQRYRVTDTILADLREAVEEYDDIKVRPLGRAITEAEGSEVARAEGEENKATIVIWGWYSTTDPLLWHVYFELLRPTEFMNPLPSRLQGDLQQPALAELQEGKLQIRQGKELAYFSLLTVGIARYAKGDWDGTIARLNKALEPQISEAVIPKEQATAYFCRGVAYFSKKEYERAIKDYTKAIALDPYYTKAYNNRGVAYTRKGKYELALKDYTKVLKLNPKDVKAYNNRGLAHTEEGRYKQAIEDFNNAIRHNFDDDNAKAEAYYNRGNVYTDQGKYDLAIKDYDEAIKLNPKLAGAYSNRGVAYVYIGKYDRAIKDCTQAIMLNDHLAEAYVGRGFAYTEQGEYDRAIADYNQAITLNDHLVEAYVGRGIVYAEQGKYDRAIADYTKAIALNPHFAAAYYNRGIAYRLKGKNEKAIEDFRRVLEFSTDPGVRAEAKGHLQELGVH